ncbi:MAG: hypothetical protein PVJ67_01150 [Candidatus Pacearchaeota archaeon]|jgi:hypothetical protein
MKNIEDLTEQEILGEIMSLEEQGFQFFVDSHSDKETPFYVPDRVKLPDGKILEEKELRSELKKDPYNKNFQNGLYLFDLCFSEQYGDDRFTHYSFDGDEDVENCRWKYEK